MIVPGELLAWPRLAQLTIWMRPGWRSAFSKRTFFNTPGELGFSCAAGTNERAEKGTIFTVCRSRSGYRFAFGMKRAIPCRFRPIVMRCARPARAAATSTRPFAADRRARPPIVAARRSSWLVGQRQPRRQSRGRRGGKSEEEKRAHHGLLLTRFAKISVPFSASSLSPSPLNEINRVFTEPSFWQIRGGANA